MRRISLALALVGAVAAAGCSGGAKAPTSNGGAKGVADGNFTLTVQNGQGQTNDALKIKGGYVTSTPAGIDCGIPGHDQCSATFALNTQVVLTATPVGTDPAYNAAYLFLGFAGDCQGTGACTLSGNADKYVVAMFAGKVLSHPNFSDPTVHVAQWIDGALDCKSCHGATLHGQGIAPSCASCHTWPITGFTKNFTADVGHFDASAEPWGNHSGQNWGQACQRCHTDQGFRDFIGQLAAPTENGTPSDDHLGGAVGAPAKSTNTLTTDTSADAYTHGPLKCQTCHNSVSDPLSASSTLAGIKFPSTKQVTSDKNTTLCVQCHQARESSASIDAAVAAASGPDAQVNATSGVAFKNGHYLGAGATLFGSEAAGWAQYTVRGGTASNVYTARNEHGGVNSCTFCHDAHNGALPRDAEIATKCGSCHFNEAGGPVKTFMELEETRQFGFGEADVDGDGVVEPVKTEIDGLASKLYDAMQAYATTVTTQGVCYSTTYPYFFKHTGTGACTTAEQVTANAYVSFTPSLMRAAYNYNWYQREPGAWAHNPRYATEILFDAISDLKAGLVVTYMAANSTATLAQATAAIDLQVPFTGLRSFNGHFGGADSADRYAQFLYDATASAANPYAIGAGFGSADCYQCHGGKGGFATYLANAPATLATTTTLNGVAVMDNKVTGMQCATCHTLSGTDMKGIRTDVANIYFPPQKAGANGQVTVAADTVFAKPADRVCATCHTGRENTTSVDLTIGTKLANDWSISFKNPHYLGAAGVMFGSNSHMMYEYTGKTYAAYPAFWQSDLTKSNGPHGSPHAQSCTSCHNPQGTRHSFEVNTATSVPAGTYNGAVNTETCEQCHVQSSHGDFRLPPLKANVQALSDLLYSTIQSYTTTAAADQTANPGAKPACYSDKYPYWYDATATSNCTANLVSANGAKLNPAAARAAFNYKWSKAEPGAYAHNYEYMVQALIDSILDLNPAATLPIDVKTNATIVRP